MSNVVTLQKTPPLEDTHIFELQAPGNRVGTHDADIEVDQITVVDCSSLCGADAVGVVTNRARSFILKMSIVAGKALVVENAVSTVTFIAQRVSVTALLRKVRRLIPISEEMWEVGAVRTLGAGGAVGTVAIAAVNHTRERHGSHEAGHVAVHARCGNRMIRRARLLEFQPRICLGDLSGDCRLDAVRIVRVTFEAYLVLVLDLLGRASGYRYAGGASHRAGYNRRLCSDILRGMRIVTVDALDVSGRCDRRFLQVMYPLIP